MAVSIAGLRRNIKNVAHNYTDAQVGCQRNISCESLTLIIFVNQVKVREATSNDPWGPSSTQMSEIAGEDSHTSHLPSPPHHSILFNPICADLTYNMVAFSEIMQMIWKRLNDHGKNWRHVYKAMVLLEYLIKTGSEKVRGEKKEAEESLFFIQTVS